MSHKNIILLKIEKVKSFKWAYKNELKTLSTYSLLYKIWFFFPKQLQAWYRRRKEKKILNRKSYNQVLFTFELMLVIPSTAVFDDV